MILIFQVKIFFFFFKLFFLNFPKYFIKFKKKKKNFLFFKKIAEAPRVTHSYVKPPENFPDIKCYQVVPEINREWISIPVGSEHYSFCNMRKNTYEEALFKIEDEKHEMDCVILLLKQGLKLAEISENEPDASKKKELIKKIHRLKILKKTDFVGEISESMEFIKTRLLERVYFFLKYEFFNFFSVARSNDCQGKLEKRMEGNCGKKLHEIT